MFEMQASAFSTRVDPFPTRSWSGFATPSMGNLDVSGNHLWLSGRWDDEVYRIDTRTGEVRRIRVGLEPHGLTVWPQPRRYSLGHAGNMR
jgi:hypothetical protein